MKKIELKQSTRGSIRKVLMYGLAAAILFSNTNYVKADELTDQINQNKSQLDETSKKVNDLKNFIANKQKELKDLNGQLQLLDSRVELIQLQLKSTELEIETTGAEIQKTENNIQIKEEEIAKQKTSVDNVIRQLYKEKDINILSVIIGSANFSELVERTEYLTKIRAKLKDDLERLKVMKAELEKQKEDLTKKKDSLEVLKQDKELEENAIEEQRYAKVKIVESTRGQESEYQSQLSQARAEEQAISSEVVRLVQEQARRKRAAEPVQGRDGRQQVVNQGGFGYPLPGVNRISVTGGDFMDPAYGMGFPHTGVDLAAKQGTPVMSAGAGTVLVAHDSGGPGLSYIAIDHGNGLVTKYLHVSSIMVSTGDVVNAGDIIGLSGGSPGSRGAGIFTTGAHLHFEIDDYNGNPVNPHNYLQIAPPLF